MKKKRVLLVSCNSLGTGGVQSVIMNIVRSLHDEYYFDILLFNAEKSYYEDEFLSYGGHIYKIPYYNGKSRIKAWCDIYFRSIRISRRLKQLLQQVESYDIIHCHNRLEAWYCNMVAQKMGIPIRISHAHTIISEGKMYEKLVNRLFRRLLIKYTTVCLGCSDDACRSLYGDTQYRVINNPYDDLRYKMREKDYSPTNMRLIQVGQFCANKDQLFTIDVFCEIVKEFSDAELYFVGFGDAYRKQMEKAIEKYGMGENVSFFPSDYNSAELLKNSFAFLFPSVTEGFGLVLIEAQAMGVRCYASEAVPISTNMGGVTYLPKGNPQLWKERICNDYINWDRKREKYDCIEFSSSMISGKYREIYNSQNRRQEK